MVINKVYECTVIDIWSPKYYSDSGGWEVWLSKSKVSHASPIIIINFTKSKHLKGQRFCVRRAVAERCEVGSNGKIPVYRVEFDKLEPWVTSAEIKEEAFNAFKD